MACVILLITPLTRWFQWSSWLQYKKYWVTPNGYGFKMCDPPDYNTRCVILLITQFIETVSRCVILLIMHGMSNPADYSSSLMKQPRNFHFETSKFGNQKISHNSLKKPPIALKVADMESYPRENYNWPCWLQQPGKWTYNPMSKSATTEELWGDLLRIILMIIDSQQADCTNLGNELTIPCLSQQPHNHMHTYIAHALHITYPMAYFKMAYQIHVQRPIRRWSIFINSTSTTSCGTYNKVC